MNRFLVPAALTITLGLAPVPASAQLWHGPGGAAGAAASGGYTASPGTWARYNAGAAARQPIAAERRATGPATRRPSAPRGLFE
jgi:hypothetical protein